MPKQPVRDAFAKSKKIKRFIVEDGQCKCKHWGTITSTQKENDETQNTGLEVLNATFCNEVTKRGNEGVERNAFLKSFQGVLTKVKSKAKKCKKFMILSFKHK